MKNSSGNHPKQPTCALPSQQVSVESYTDSSAHGTHHIIPTLRFWKEIWMYHEARAVIFDATFLDKGLSCFAQEVIHSMLRN